MAVQTPMNKVRGWVTFLEEVWSELKKVHWPTPKETYAATGVVLVIVGIVALYLGLVDAGLTYLVRAVLG